MAAATWSNSAKASATRAVSLGRPRRRRSPGSEAGRGVIGKDAARPGRLGRDVLGIAAEVEQGALAVVLAHRGEHLPAVDREGQQRGAGRRVRGCGK
jgi:hypothetical protein